MKLCGYKKKRRIKEKIQSEEGAKEEEWEEKDDLMRESTESNEEVEPTKIVSKMRHYTRMLISIYCQTEEHCGWLL
jgi:hypothetical protein